jgi:hypothetical protein
VLAVKLAWVLRGTESCKMTKAVLAVADTLTFMDCYGYWRIFVGFLQA